MSINGHLYGSLVSGIMRLRVCQWMEIKPYKSTLSLYLLVREISARRVLGLYLRSQDGSSNTLILVYNKEILH